MYCSSPRIWGGLVICFVQLNVVTVCSCEPRPPEAGVLLLSLLEAYLASCEEVLLSIISTDNQTWKSNPLAKHEAKHGYWDQLSLAPNGRTAPPVHRLMSLVNAYCFVSLSLGLFVRQQCVAILTDIVGEFKDIS